MWLTLTFNIGFDFESLQVPVVWTKVVPEGTTLQGPRILNKLHSSTILQGGRQRAFPCRRGNFTFDQKTGRLRLMEINHSRSSRNLGVDGNSSQVGSRKRRHLSEIVVGRRTASSLLRCKLREGTHGASNWALQWLVSLKTINEIWLIGLER